MIPRNFCYYSIPGLASPLCTLKMELIDSDIVDTRFVGIKNEAVI